MNGEAQSEGGMLHLVLDDSETKREAIVRPKGGIYEE